MIHCYDVGQLRAYLEDTASLAADELAQLDTHLTECPACRSRFDGLRALEASVTSRLSMLAPTQAPDVQPALMKMRGRLREEQSSLNLKEGVGLMAAPAKLKTKDRSKTMQTFTFARPGHRRALFSTLIMAALVASLVAFPSLRAAADNLLQTFRARSVVFLPVDSSRIQQLRDLSTDRTALFLSKPAIVGTSSSTVVGSLDEASREVGFVPEQPSTFPSGPTTTEIKIQGSTKVQAQVNVATIRELMQALDITDVSLPDALGSAPITANVPSFVESSYTGTGYQLTLVQGRNPTVTMPGGVDLQQLGKVGLRLIGMQPEQADQMSRQIDWSSTLVVPFPAGLRDVVRVQVGSAEGLMVGTYGGGADSQSTQQRAVIYWQNGDRFYVLAGEGHQLSNDLLLLAARSVK